MLCYAWDVLPQAGLVDIKISGKEQPIDLLALVLISGTHHLLRRGIDQDYQAVEEELTTLRGRVDFAYSERKMLLQQGRALCFFDEMTADILPNKILKTTLTNLSRLWGLDTLLRKRTSILVRKFNAVKTVTLTPSIFSRVKLHGNNRFYRFLINICELIYHACMLDEQSGSYRFRDFYRDSGQMPRLYERFIFNFYKHKQRLYRVSSDRIRWNAISEDDPSLTLLPTMLTDISLRSDNETIIIDAKYYQETLASFHGNKRIHSSNLYQLNAYLQNVEMNGGNDAQASGILLYPVVEEKVSKSYQIAGKIVRVETVDLAEEWQDIERQLLLLIK